jgi:hypothetical protein
MRRNNIHIARVATRSVLRGAVSSILAAILVVQAAPVAAARAVPGLVPEEQTSSVQTLKQKALNIPPQSMVQLKLKTKERLRGRLVQVNDEGLVMKIAQGQTIEDRTVAFADMKSMKAENTGSSKKKWIIAVAVIAGIVVFIGIMAHLTTDH